MHWPEIELNKEMLAGYLLLRRYSTAWQTIDLSLLEEILDADVVFDAPGVPYDIVGLDKVLRAHKVWFDSLNDNDMSLRTANLERGKMSGYDVFTQMYPYDNQLVFPFMQLSFFVEEMFLKIYYFYVQLDKELRKIKEIKTRHNKFMVSVDQYAEYVKMINECNGMINNTILE